MFGKSTMNYKTKDVPTSQFGVFSGLSSARRRLEISIGISKNVIHNNDAKI